MTSTNPSPPGIVCGKCKRCIHCLYAASVLENTVEGSYICIDNAVQQTPPPPTTTTLPSTIPNCSCQETPLPKPPISACYTCTRAVNHHRQLRPRLRRLAELFDTATGDHAPPMHVGDDGRGEIVAPEDADLSLLQRFLLCSENEAPSLLALGSGAGALNISAARNYERKVGA